MRRRGQLFLIEVIISLSVLLILVTTLFATQNFSPPVGTSNLQQRGEQAIEALIESGDMFAYLEASNDSYYVQDNDIMDANDPLKIAITETIYASLPVIANFKVHVERNNTISSFWEQIDIINFELSLPSSGNLVIIEHYIPGFNGVFDEFIFRLSIWFEVDV